MDKSFQKPPIFDCQEEEKTIAIPSPYCDVRAVLFSFSSFATILMFEKWKCTFLIEFSPPPPPAPAAGANIGCKLKDAMQKITLMLYL